MGAHVPAQDSPGHARPSRLREFSHGLSHPLLIAVVIAVLGNFLIPNFTRKWQDHQKALEIKTGLVSDMGESISNAVMTGRFISAGLVSRSSADPRADQRAFNDGYRAWTTSNASIGAKIQAYFGNDLGSQWRSFANVVTDYFQLSATPGSGRKDQVQEILSYPALRPLVRLSEAERRALVKSNSSATFQNAYGRLGSAMLARGDGSCKACSTPASPGSDVGATVGPRGALAQLGERRLCKPEVTGSIPVRSIEENSRTSWVIVGSQRRRLERSAKGLLRNSCAKSPSAEPEVTVRRSSSADDGSTYRTPESKRVGGLGDARIEEVRVALERDQRVCVPGDRLDEFDVSAGRTRRETQVWRRSWKR